MKLELQTKRAQWLILALIVLVLDYVTKQYASSVLSYAQPVPVIPVFNFTLVHNYGAAWSFLADQGGWQRWFFAVIAIVVSAGLIGWLLFTKQVSQWERLAIALVLGGALGNLYDRVFLGYVIDFLDFHYAGRHFPAFNIADVGISCGAAILIFDSLFFTRGKHE
jgi:signal peptidase II